MTNMRPTALPGSGVWEGMGPMKVEYNFYSCSGCIYFKSKMEKSGPNPEHSYFCGIAYQDSSRKIEINILANHLKAPDWCPFLLNMVRPE